MKQFVIFISLYIALFALSGQAQTHITDLAIEGLNGRVQNLQEQTADIKMSNGVAVESGRHRTKEIVFDLQGRMTRRWQLPRGLMKPHEQIYTYDKQGNRYGGFPFEKNVMSAGSSTYGRKVGSLTVFRYAANENALYEEIYAGEEVKSERMTQRWRYRFDSENRLVSRVLYTLDGHEGLKDIYIYDSDRNPIERRLTIEGNPNPQIIKYKYEATDAQGNWTKRIAEDTLGNADHTLRVEITYRKISYY